MAEQVPISVQPSCLGKKEVSTIQHFLSTWRAGFATQCGTMNQGESNGLSHLVQPTEMSDIYKASH